MEAFDLVVIGSGPGGYTGAIRAAQLGLKTAIIEKDPTFGGTCLNVGCIPSKALLESSEYYAAAAHDLPSHGIKISGLELDLAKMLERKSKIVSELTKGIGFLLKKNKIKSFRGLGKIIDSNKVQIEGEDAQTIEAKNIMIATGSIPNTLPGLSYNGDTIVSSTEALAFSKVPKHLVVVGAGAIGLEMGSVWSRLGSEVTVIEFASKICGPMDAKQSAMLQKILTKQGMKFFLDSKVTKAETKNNEVHVTFAAVDGSKTQEITCDKLLIAAGRIPFTEGLGLDSVGIQPNKRGQIEVDNHYRTKVKNIFAIGDVIPGPMLAHKAEEEGVAVAEIIVTGAGHVNYNTVPSVIYTWPEFASVGKSEEELKAANIEFNAGTFPFAANGRAKAIGMTDGQVKVLADKNTDEVLGVHVLGPRASDVLAEAVVAMEFKASSEDIGRSFHAHPTLSEVMREAALAVEKRARQM